MAKKRQKRNQIKRRRDSWVSGDFLKNFKNEMEEKRKEYIEAHRALNENYPLKRVLMEERRKTYLKSNMVAVLDETESPLFRKSWKKSLKKKSVFNGMGFK